MPSKGFKHSVESRAKMSASHLGANPSYQAIHKWVRNRKTYTGICEMCGERPEPNQSGYPSTEFANVSGEYRRDVNDYIEVCRTCHRKYDQ